MDKKGLALLGALLIAYLAYNTFYFAPRMQERRRWEQEQARLRQEREQAEAAAAASASLAAAGSASPAAGPGEQVAAPPPEPERPSAPVVTVQLDTPEHTIELTSRGASLANLTFKRVLESRYKPIQPGSADSREARPYHALHPYVPEVPSLGLVPTGVGASAEHVLTSSWSHEPIAGGGHRFWLDLPDGLRLVKEFTPPAPPPAGDAGAPPSATWGFHFQLLVRVENRGRESRQLGYELWSPVGILNQDSGYRATGTQVVLADQEGSSIELTTEVASNLQSVDDDVVKVDTQAGQGWISYYGVGTHYFAAVVVPDREARPVRLAEADSPLRRLGRAPTKADQAEDGLAHQAFARGIVPARALAPGQAISDRYMVYVGPRQKKLFEDEAGPYAGYGLERLVDFGWFESLARVLLALLFGLHAVCGNWGVSIILLTFVVRGVILPLSIWSQKNMLRMQRLAPEINSLKEKFTKKDGSMTPEQQRAFSAAQMDLFRKHSVNPVGCVGPIFLQIPVFVGLYNALNSSFELRQTEFLGWMTDLSVPEVLFRLPFALPILGTNALSVLPLIMIGTYLLQHALSPVPTDPRAAEQHKIMRFMFPLFGLLMYTMPSGLMIYFITSSLWSIGEMKTVKRWIEKAENEEIARRAGAAAGAGQFPGLQR